MHDQPTCQGCGSDLANRARRWCERCAPASQDIRAVRQAARLLRTYGLVGQASTVEAALEDLLEQLRTGRGPARAVAKGRAEELAARDAARRAAQERDRLDHPATIALHEALCDEGGGPRVAPWDDIRYSWILDFTRSLPVEQLQLQPSLLLPAVRRYIEAERQKLAETCRCGHEAAHPEGVGCVKRGCGCGSPRRARRAAESVARARTWTHEDLRRAWPQL